MPIEKKKSSVILKDSDGGLFHAFPKTKAELVDRNGEPVVGDVEELDGNDLTNLAAEFKNTQTVTTQTVQLPTPILSSTYIEYSINLGFKSNGEYYIYSLSESDNTVTDTNFNGIFSANQTYYMNFNIGNNNFEDCCGLYVIFGAHSYNSNSETGYSASITSISSLQNSPFASFTTQEIASFYPQYETWEGNSVDNYLIPASLPEEGRTLQWRCNVFEKYNDENYEILSNEESYVDISIQNLGEGNFRMQFVWTAPTTKTTQTVSNMICLHSNGSKKNEDALTKSVQQISGIGTGLIASANVKHSSKYEEDETTLKPIEGIYQPYLYIGDGSSDAAYKNVNFNAYTLIIPENNLNQTYSFNFISTENEIPASNYNTISISSIEELIYIINGSYGSEQVNGFFLFPVHTYESSYSTTRYAEDFFFVNTESISLPQNVGDSVSGELYCATKNDLLLEIPITPK